MAILDDKTIRGSLIVRLANLSIPPRKILEELRVHNGSAIADVVTVHTHAHCYEIKGASDSIHRILRQSKYYDLAFTKTTLVTTENHIEQAMRLAPSHWGVMRAFERNNVVSINYVRAAKQSPYFDKQLALLTLWKSELMDIALPILPEKLEKYSRLHLSELIATKKDKDELSKSISDMLTLRES